MITSLFISIFCVFAFLSIYIGKKSVNKEGTSEGFFLSGKSLGAVSIALTLIATQVGGGSLAGASEEAFNRGWVVLWYPAGMCLGLVILALGLAKKLREEGLTTVAELFEKKFGSKALRKVSSLISVLSLFFILIGQGVAARMFFAALGLDAPLYFFLFWAVVIVYTAWGGLKAVVITDVFQILFVFVIFALVFVTKKEVPDSSIAEPVARGTIPWLSWLLMPLLFMLFEQDMAQRCFAAKSTRSFKIAGVIAAIGVFIATLFSIYFGILAKKSGIPIVEGQGVLISAIMQLTSPVVGTLFAIAFLLVILSTTDSLLCSVASNIALDFGVFKKRSLRISQWVTFIVGILAMLLSFAFNKILPLLIGSYEFFIATLFVPTLLTLFAKMPNKKAVVGSMSAGALCFAIFRLWEPPFPREILTLVFTYLAYALIARFSLRKEVRA